MRTCVHAALWLVGALACVMIPEAPANLGIGAVQAQAKPAPLISPEVHADRRITFRLKAPKASEVTVAGDWGGGAKALTKDGLGTWSLTLGPLPGEIYQYGFTVDGLQMVDPSNPLVKPQRLPRTSIVEVPGDPPLVHEFQAVKHGTVHVHSYQSKSLGSVRRLHVCTPPGYTDGDKTQYPVLYLLHGSGDNDATWTVLGRAHVIADNLLSQGKVRPMLIVMPDGHPAPPGSDAKVSNTEAMRRDLLEDVMPLIEGQYRVRADAGSRAIAGLSMGGGQALTIGLNHADRFGWIGAFSSSIPAESALAAPLGDAKGTNEKLSLLWIACGKDDFLLKNNEQFDALLKTKGIEHEYRLTEGGHSWPVWRRYLAELLPRLFVEKK